MHCNSCTTINEIVALYDNIVLHAALTNRLTFEAKLNENVAATEYHYCWQSFLTSNRKYKALSPHSSEHKETDTQKLFIN